MTTPPPAMALDEMLNLVYDADIGWRPTSGGIKPVHVANGLVRAVTGEHYDTTPIIELIVWQKSGKPMEKRTAQALVERPEYQAFRGRPAQFELFRRHARGILGADRAVFPDAEISSLTLASAPMVSRDHSDRRMGRFEAALLGSRDDPSSLAAVLHEAVAIDTPLDPWTATCWPILPRTPRTVPSSDPDAAVAALQRDHARAIVAHLADAAADLATHERQQGNRLRTIQRVSSFGIAATISHAQTIAADGDLDQRPPLLLSMLPKATDVSRASETSVDMMIRELERWIGARLAFHLRSGELKHLKVKTRKDVERLLQEVRTSRGRSWSLERAVPGRLEKFNDRLGDDGDIVDAAARALMDSYLVEFESAGPRRFLLRLASWSGLLYPHTAGDRRRVSPSVPMLDTLVRSCVPTDRLIPYEEFLDRLWERFGIVVGGRVSGHLPDLDLLASRNLEVDPVSLGANAEAFVGHLRQMGLARKFADHVTFVGERHAF